MTTPCEKLLAEVEARLARLSHDPLSLVCEFCNHTVLRSAAGKGFQFSCMNKDCAHGWYDDSLSEDCARLAKMVRCARKFMLNVLHTLECEVEEGGEPNPDECYGCLAEQELGELDRLAGEKG